MHSNAQLAFKFIKYFFTASNGKGHGIHSPFVYDFVTKVLNKKNTPENIAAIEARRKSLEANAAVIEVLDRGAGSRQSEFKKRSIREIAKSALKQKKISQLFFLSKTEELSTKLLRKLNSFNPSDTNIYMNSRRLMIGLRQVIYPKHSSHCSNFLRF